MANDGDIRNVPNKRLAELLDWAESEDSSSEGEPDAASSEPIAPNTPENQPPYAKHSFNG